MRVFAACTMRAYICSRSAAADSHKIFIDYYIRKLYLLQKNFDYEVISKRQ